MQESQNDELVKRTNTQYEKAEASKDLQIQISTSFDAVRSKKGKQTDVEAIIVDNEADLEEQIIEIENQEMLRMSTSQSQSPKARVSINAAESEDAKTAL